MNQLASSVNAINDAQIVDVSGTKIIAGTLPASAMNAAANVETRFDEALDDFVASGCVWSASAGLTGNMTAGVVYIDGKRNAISAITGRTFTASKDTYVAVSNSGTVSYTEVANNASSPTLPANNIWLAIVVTSGAAITSVNTGQIGATFPSVGGRVLMVSDTNGALICPKQGQSQLAIAQNVGSAILTAGAGNTSIVSVAVIPRTTAKSLKVTAFIPNLTAGGAAIGTFRLFDGTTAGTQIQSSQIKWQDSGDNNFVFLETYVPIVSTAAKTFTLSGAATSNNLQYNVSATAPAYISVEAV